MLQRIGPYEVHDELGRGGSGAVMRGRDPASGDVVAIKVLLAGRGASAVARERFMREGHALRRLRHPGIVAVRAVGEAQGLPFIVMDLVRGESLEARLVRGPLEEQQAARLGSALARALGHAHASAVIHRDVKPSNVLLDATGEPRLTDFGLAKELDARQSLTQSGAMLGTPGFCAPEQALAERGGMGPPADVYGLGATLYAALTGAAPITGASALEVMVATRSLAVAPPSTLRPGLDPALEEIVLRCLAKDPAARPAPAEALADELDAWLRAASPRARRRRERDRRARRALGVGAAATLGALVSAVAIGAHLTRPATSETESRDGPGANGPGANGSGANGSGANGPGANGPGANGPGANGPGANGPGANGSGANGPGANGPGANGPGANGPGANGPGANGPGANGPGANGPGANGPGAVARPAADGPQAREARALLARARTADERGAKDDALRDYARAVELDPGLDEAALGLGDLRLARGDLVGALEAYDGVVAAAPEVARAWACRSTVRQAMGDPVGALEDAERASSLAPEDPFIDDVLGTCRASAGDLRGALEALDRAVARAPEYVPARLDRVPVRIAAGDLDGALADASQAVLLAPADGRAWLYLGTAHYARGSLVKAEAAHGHAADLPGSVVRAAALACRAACRFEREDVDGALEDAEAALALRPDDGLGLAMRSLARTRRGDRQAALDDARRAVALAPTQALGFVAQGEALRTQGDVAGSLAAYDHALELDSRCALALFARGTLRALTGDGVRAEEDLTRAIDLHPRLGLAWINRANVRAGHDPQAALADLDRAVELLPGQHAVIHSRAALRERLDDRAGAAADYEEALRLGATDPTLRLRIGRLLADCREYARARPHLDAAVQREAELGLALAHRGSVLHQLGERDAARRDLLRAVELLPADGDDGRFARDALAALDAAPR